MRHATNSKAKIGSVKSGLMSPTDKVLWFRAQQKKAVRAAFLDALIDEG
jgi:hypothetical protein